MWGTFPGSQGRAWECASGLGHSHYLNHFASLPVDYPLSSSSSEEEEGEVSDNEEGEEEKMEKKYVSDNEEVEKEV